ncbi:hypothetical protein [Altererythrobacter sp. TH136]|uniref:hypothetical protein n=1 Tax=Altererythrobacter sp. TH136 TaxID=2067415 RepID=UPI001162C402|nr:hypothetical protein [Altererythrobacter sp. TH136]QDM41809.1 hypothetical protein C0V74_12735 [Altererythrobacter sp. TH136]
MSVSKSKLMALALASVVVSGLMHSAPAMAASQGTVGPTSSGSVSISASVPNRARISGLSDITFLNQDPTVPASGAQNVCIWSNTATKAYTITASGNGTANAFTLNNGSSTVPYSVAWASSINQTTGTTLTSGTASASLISTATNQTCASGPAASASLIVGISASDLGTMSAGSNYLGTLTLLITPQ